MDEHDGFVDAITPDVMEALRRVKFFEALDEQMCPADSARPKASCQGSFAISTPILAERGFDSQAVGEIIQVLEARGAHCDCEVLFNVADHSRLKSQYWMFRMRRHDIQPGSAHDGH